MLWTHLSWNLLLCFQNYEDVHIICIFLPGPRLVKNLASNMIFPLSVKVKDRKTLVYLDVLDCVECRLYLVLSAPLGVFLGCKVFTLFPHAFVFYLSVCSLHFFNSAQRASCIQGCGVVWSLWFRFYILQQSLLFYTFWKCPA